MTLDIVFIVVISQDIIVIIIAYCLIVITVDINSTRTSNEDLDLHINRSRRSITQAIIIFVALIVVLLV